MNINSSPNNSQSTTLPQSPKQDSVSQSSASTTTSPTSFYTNLKEMNPQTTLTENEKISKLFERIFQLTVDPNYSNSNNKCIFIGELMNIDNNASNDTLLMKENLDEILLQRLMMTDRNHLEERVRPAQLTQSASKTSRLELKCLEPCQFNYLFESFKRLHDSRRHFVALNRIDLFDFSSNLIINICRTLLNIFDSTASNIDFNINVTNQNDPQAFSLNNKEEQEYHLIKNNPIASSDLSIQFVLLIIENFDDSYGSSSTLSSSSDNPDTPLLEQFFDKFINSFEETDSVRAIMEKGDYANNQINTERELADLLQLDSCELRFLNNLFVYLNKYFIKVSQCDDYTNKYIRNVELVKFMTRSRLMKYLLIFNSFPNVDSGRVWQADTLIGKLLTAHSLPIASPARQSQQLNIEYRYFTNPTQLTKRDIEINEKNIWQIQLMIKKQQNAFFFEHLIRKNSNRLIRDLLLKWIGKCMFANKAKTQEWLGYMQTNMYLNNNEHLSKFSSDGFFLNLLDLLLDYSMPFCNTPFSNKLLKINFNYANSTTQTFVHGLDKETKLISNASPAKSTADFNFITECFYATHNCLRLAYVSLYQKLMKINGELSRWQSTYQQLMENSMMASNDPQMSRLKTLYENMTIEFLNIKSALLENDLLSKLVKFLTSTSSWLVYISLFADSNYETATVLKQLESSADVKKKTDQFNLNILSAIPEYFLTNVVEFLIFLSRFKESDIVDLLINNNGTNNDNGDYSNLNGLISLFLVFMGHSERLFNPHCRASLVEAIEILMPKKSSSSNGQYDYFNRKNLAYYVFAQHPCASYLSEALINVFVSIEMTGQSVQFEQKFNYRRPMYELMDFLWNMPVLYANEANFDNVLLGQHRVQIKRLADEAYKTISNSEQPLFLKFLNFLINDANFLLLEGLLYLEKIKTLQEKMEQESHQQHQQPPPPQPNQQQRNEQEANLKHMIMLAKFHNFMSTKTIQTIKMLTSQITDIFCHDVLVDRIATMLNDFLLHLVGKKRRQFKVKNLEEVEFHPKEIVSNICDIYLNLGSTDNFCRAVCRDGRSYSAELFQQAKEVLALINRDFTIIENFTKLGEKIEELYRLQQLEELNFDDAPDEYLDPIMSNIMDDPVMLPNSKQIVDRSTIARHLLSDQSDPFNRSPLTLQEVIPATELKSQIEQWKASKRSKQ